MSGEMTIATSPNLGRWAVRGKDGAVDGAIGSAVCGERPAGGGDTAKPGVVVGNGAV